VPASEASAVKKLSVGGQAVIEGVMMRSPKSFAVVCRRPDDSIVIKESEWRPIWAGVRPLRWPLLRGGVVLLESLVNGISALTFSANQQMIEAESTETEASADASQDPQMPEAKAIKAKAPKAGPPLRSLGARSAEQPEEGGSTLATFGMVAVSLAFGLALFVGAPHLAAWGLGELLGFDTSSVAFHAVDGVIKLAILIGYMAAISLLPDIRRVFQYHGAEHKAIYTHEMGLPLTVENARKQTRFHPRCGTSFLLIVIMVSVVIFSATLRFQIAESAVVDNLLKIGIKIPLMFPVAGLSYELIKLAGKYWETSLLAKIGSAPGLWLQKITTKEPDDAQLEIALISIRKTLWRESLGKDAAPVGVQGIEVYASAADIDLPLTATT
jgi:uncharacterized protein YqhQ